MSFLLRAANPGGRSVLRAAAGGLRERLAPGRAAELEDPKAGSRELGYTGWHGEAVTASLLLRPSQDGAAQAGGVDLRGWSSVVATRNALMHMASQAAPCKRLQDGRSRAHEAGGLLGERGHAIRAADPQSEAALVGDHGAHPRVAHEPLNKELLPGLGSERVLMEEVAPPGKLHPVYLDGETENDLSFREAPGPFCGLHPVVVRGCVEPAVVGALGGAHDQEGLVPVNPIADASTV